MEILRSIFESVLLQPILATIGVLGSIVASAFALYRWWLAQRRSHAEFLKNLMEQFEDDSLRQTICSLESDDGGRMFFAEDNRQSPVASMERLLNFMTYLCYLHKNGHIEDDEFLVFELSLRKVLSDSAIQEFLAETKELAEQHDVANPYRHLYEYGTRHEIFTSTHKATAETKKGTPTMTTQSNPTDLAVADFDRPTVLIKINRRYKDGMTQDEIFEAMSKWWRVNPRDEISLGLAIANGEVKGVFACDGWRKDKTGEFGYRYEFLGHPADEQTTSKYIGRSVKTLFPKGAANPIRYFGT